MTNRDVTCIVDDGGWMWLQYVVGWKHDYLGHYKTHPPSTSTPPTNQTPHQQSANTLDNHV